MTPGYSGKPLSKKLGIAAGMMVVTVGAPSNYAELLMAVPEDVLIVEAGDRPSVRAKSSTGPADMVHLFTNSRDDLFRKLAEYKTLIKQDGTIWVSWYKRAAKLPTEITEDTVREAALPLGLVDVKVCAVDDNWSGLKLVIRKENRS
ncbi:MAG TPA: DUF3052 family protein [Pyrinomonadaceae bacterium]|nr:DUF3052 family protein [Pyrinomonadaceae bacterium]